MRFLSLFYIALVAMLVVLGQVSQSTAQKQCRHNNDCPRGQHCIIGRGRPHGFCRRN